MLWEDLTMQLKHVVIIGWALVKFWLHTIIMYLTFFGTWWEDIGLHYLCGLTIMGTQYENIHDVLGSHMSL